MLSSFLRAVVAVLHVSRHAVAHRICFTVPQEENAMRSWLFVRVAVVIVTLAVACASSPAGGVTVTGRVVLGYGNHSPVEDLPLWIGTQSQGEPTTRTSADGEFTLIDLPIGTVNIVDDHLTFQVPVTSSGERIDLGLLKYPLMHPPTYYMQEPSLLTNLSILSEGQSVQFSVCLTDNAWSRPTEQEQRNQVWSKRPFNQQGDQHLKWWFRQPAAIYDTMDIFTQSFPDGPRLDDLASDWLYLLGMWTGKRLSPSECSYDSQALDDLLDRKQIEVWLLDYRANSVRRVGEHFAVEVSLAKGFQIIRFAGNEGAVAIHVVMNDREIIRLPKFCRGAANLDCSG
jgi:hypothetical protein